MLNQEPEIRCADCGTRIKASDPKCPNCGSFNRGIHTIDNERGDEYLKIEKWKPDSKHKKNRADYEKEQGVTFGKDGNLVFKKKIKDREHPNSPGSYVEFIQSKDGNIIIEKSEKLSEHQTKKIK